MEEGGDPDNLSAGPRVLRTRTPSKKFSNFFEKEEVDTAIGKEKDSDQEFDDEEDDSDEDPSWGGQDEGAGIHQKRTARSTAVIEDDDDDDDVEADGDSEDEWDTKKKKKKGMPTPKKGTPKRPAGGPASRNNTPVNRTTTPMRTQPVQYIQSPGQPQHMSQLAQMAQQTPMLRQLLAQRGGQPGQPSQPQPQQQAQPSMVSLTPAQMQLLQQQFAQQVSQNPQLQQQLQQNPQLYNQYQAQFLRYQMQAQHQHLARQQMMREQLKQQQQQQQQQFQQGQLPSMSGMSSSSIASVLNPAPSTSQTINTPPPALAVPALASSSLMNNSSVGGNSGMSINVTSLSGSAAPSPGSAPTKQSNFVPANLQNLLNPTPATSQSTSAPAQQQPAQPQTTTTLLPPPSQIQPQAGQTPQPGQPSSSLMGSLPQLTPQQQAILQQRMPNFQSMVYGLQGPNGQPIDVKTLTPQQQQQLQQLYMQRYAQALKKAQDAKAAAAGQDPNKVGAAPNGPPLPSMTNAMLRSSPQGINPNAPHYSNPFRVMQQTAKAPTWQANATALNPELNPVQRAANAVGISSSAPFSMPMINQPNFNAFMSANPNMYQRAMPDTAMRPKEEEEDDQDPQKKAMMTLVKQCESYSSQIREIVRQWQDKTKANQTKTEAEALKDSKAHSEGLVEVKPPVKEEETAGENKPSGGENKPSDQEGEVKQENGAVSKPEEKETPQADLITQPELLQFQLRPYQLVGLNWLYLLFQQKINGILADEMGLGKTIQTIAFFSLLKQRGESKKPHIIVVPATALENWVREFALWCPSMNVAMYHGTAKDRETIRRQLLPKEENGPCCFDVLITTYNLAINKQDRIKFFKKLQFSYIVLDEAHSIKNVSSVRYQALLKLAFRADFRLMLTGTPLQNNMKELWALLNFLMPTIFNCTQNFKALKEDEDDKAEEIERVKKIISPFVLRRLKADVLGKLPPKIDTTVWCEMTAFQSELYRKTYQFSKTKFHAIKNKEETADGAADAPPESQLTEEEKAELSKNPDEKSLHHILMQLRKAANNPLLYRIFYTDEKLREMQAVLEEAEKLGPVVEDVDPNDADQQPDSEKAATETATDAAPAEPAAEAMEVEGGENNADGEVTKKKEEEIQYESESEPDEEEDAEEEEPTSSKDKDDEEYDPMEGAPEGDRNDRSVNRTEVEPDDLSNEAAEQSDEPASGTSEPSVSGPAFREGEECLICFSGGDLLICDGPCKGTFHLDCIGVMEDPGDGEWFCPDCEDLSEKSKETAEETPKDPEDAEENSEEKSEEDDRATMLSIWRRIVEEEVPKSERRRSQLFMFLPSRQEYPDYYERIQSPISLNQIRAKKYTERQSFFDDFQQLFENAKTFNMPNSQVFKDAVVLEGIFHTEFSKYFGEDAVAKPKRGRPRKSTPSRRGRGGRNNQTPTRRKSNFGEEDLRRSSRTKRGRSVDYNENYEDGDYSESNGRANKRTRRSSGFGAGFGGNSGRGSAKRNSRRNLRDELDSDEEDFVAYTGPKSPGNILGSPRYPTRRLPPKPEKKVAPKMSKIHRKRKLAEPFATCRNLLDDLMDQEDVATFSSPVDLSEFTDYLEVVKKPMDLGTIWKNVNEGIYPNTEQLVNDVRLTFDNCLLYNEPNSEIGRSAQLLWTYFKRQCRKSKVKVPEATLENKKLPARNLSSAIEDFKEKSDIDIQTFCRKYKCLNQFCLSDDQIVNSSGKFIELQKLLVQIKEKGSRLLIFSQFTQVLNILEEFMTRLGYLYLRMDGSTPVLDRQTIIDEYNTNRDVFVFLLSTRAAGIGINLTSADVCIFHDIDWNPEMDRQAEARVHRIGQTKQVQVIKLLSKETIDEHILKLSQTKRARNDLVMGEGNQEEAEKTANADDSQKFSFTKVLSSIFESESKSEASETASS